MRGRRISAREGFEWGLVTEVVQDGKLDETIARWVNGLAARLSRSPRSNAFSIPLTIPLSMLASSWRARPSRSCARVPNSSSASTPSCRRRSPTSPGFRTRYPPLRAIGECSFCYSNIGLILLDTSAMIWSGGQAQEKPNDSIEMLWCLQHQPPTRTLHNGQRHRGS